MLVIKPGTWHRSDKELTAIGIGASVGHRNHIGLIKAMFFGTQLIRKIVPPYRLAPSAIPLGTPRLRHEPLNNPMKNQPIIIALFRQLDEILTGLWRVINEELDVDVAEGCVQDYLTLFCGLLLQLLDEDLLFVGALVYYVAQDAALEGLGLAAREDVETGFFVGAAIDCGVGAFALALGVAGAGWVSHGLALENADTQESLMLFGGNDPLHTFTSHRIELNAIKGRINKELLSLIKIAPGIKLQVLGSFQILLQINLPLILIILHMQHIR